MEGTARKGRIWAVAVVGAVAVTLLGAATAGAHLIISGPTITGVPQVGQTLTATATWQGTAATVTWRWQRCPPATPGTCTAINGATTTTYVPTDADVGFLLRVRLAITNSTGTETKRSTPTSPIQPASAPPPPPDNTGAPEPEPDPAAKDPADNAKTFDSPSNPAVAPAPAGAENLKVMKPFPVVRISGRLTASGAQVTRLTVRTPRGASISVRCRGRSCPVRTFAHAARLGRLRAFERHLRAGTKLDVVVRKPERIGKWTTITIRRGAPPRRVDRCSYPGRGEPAACPAG